MLCTYGAIEAVTEVVCASIGPDNISSIADRCRILKNLSVMGHNAACTARVTASLQALLDAVPGSPDPNYWF